MAFLKPWNVRPLCVFTRIMDQTYRVVGRDPSRRSPALTSPRGLPQSPCRNPSGSGGDVSRGLRVGYFNGEGKGWTPLGSPCWLYGRAGTPTPRATHRCWNASEDGRFEPLSPASGDLGTKRDMVSPCGPAASDTLCPSTACWTDCQPRDSRPGGPGHHLPQCPPG